MSELLRNIVSLLTFIGLLAVSPVILVCAAFGSPTYYVGYDTSASTFTNLTNTVNGGIPGTLDAKNTEIAAITSLNSGSLYNYDFGNLTPSTSTTGGTVLSGISDGNILSISFSGDNAANLFSGPINTLSNQGGNGINGDLPVNNGFSTVSSNGGYVFVQGAGSADTVTINFGGGINAFGIFLTGLGNNGKVAPVTVSFNDGSAQSYTTEGSIDTTGTLGGSSYTGPDNTNAGAEFFGFTDNSGAPITSVTLTQSPGGGDRYSFDNLDYNVVPEPSSVALFLVGGMGLAGLLLVRRRNNA